MVRDAMTVAEAAALANLPERILSRSEAETEALGERLGRALGGRGVVLLEGELGSGKTVLVRGLARALGVERREIQSPTYALVHEHEGSEGRLVHADLYRLEPDEVPGLGLEEHWDGEALVAVEWPDRLPFEPVVGARLRFALTEGGGREIRLEVCGIEARTPGDASP